MAKFNEHLIAFNRGRVGRLALARIDLKRIGLSAETQTNWMPRVLGSMMLKPGWQYIDSSKDNAQAVNIPFIKSTDDTALIEITNLSMRVFVDDAVVTRAAVSSAVSNGLFTTDLSGWTDADESGATSAWAAGGYMSLIGTAFNAAIQRQEVSVAVGDQGIRHALRIEIERGPVTLKVGSTAGGTDYIAETLLAEGVHSLAFTPAGNFWLDLSNVNQPAALVDSIAVESSGDMVLTAPWATSALRRLRWAQSADVMFMAGGGVQQYRIERRAVDSWSLVKYFANDGPFRTTNLTNTTLTPSALNGDITLAASNDVFTAGNEGGLYRIISVGQDVAADLTGDGQFTGDIRVIGTETGRAFDVVRAGTWTGTLTLQRSIGEPGAWVEAATYTGNGTSSFDDGLDNQIVFYRLGFAAGGYGTGTAEASLSYASGGLTGVVRITAVTDAQNAEASVLTDLGATDATSDWAEGSWSPRRGFPSAITFYEGRLWWVGKDKIYGSVSDAFDSFDPDFEGDAGPLNRSIGSGPVDDIHWLLPLQRLVIGTEGKEVAVRSSSFDEVLTPTNFNLKDPTTQGSAPVEAVKIDSLGMFVQRSGTRLYQLRQSADTVNFDYVSDDMTAVVPEIGEPSIVKAAVQRQPDTRVHCIRSDGTVGVLIFDRAEDVICWIDIETDGLVEDVAILPGTLEDAVYYSVQRTIDGNVVRFLERWSREDQNRGQPECRLADAHLIYSGAEVTTITGLSHLEGESVVVWGWNTVTPFTVTMPDGDVQTVGRDMGTFTVTGGQITGLATAVTDACVGLGYTARYKSTRLGTAVVQLGTSLNQVKRVESLGLIAADLHAGGVTYGPDFDNLDALPLVEESYDVDPNTVWTSYDQPRFEFDGFHEPDARLCIQAAAPRPATIMALTIGERTNEK